MKPEELQIGDWVLINDTPQQIKLITRKKVGYHRTPYNLDYARLNEVKPIPLTDDVLKKNGFVEIWDGKALLYRTEHGSIRITKMVPASYYRIELFINHPELIILENKIEGVRYLHTLQKMIRMFGFKKRIEL